MEAERIEAMGGQQCADALVAEVAREHASAARRLVLIAQWAVINDGETIHPRYDADGRVLPGTEQARTYGGDGTPQVAEFAVHELAMLLGLPESVARGELADVLDLQHRHPRLWARVLETAQCDTPGADPAMAAGMVQAWQARWVARRCRHANLSCEAARWVDQRTTRHLGDQAWSRFCELVDARIKAADPALAEARRRAKEASKRVTVSRTNDEGMKTLTVMLPAAQIIVMAARIHQIARTLQTQQHAAAQDTAQAPAVAPPSLGMLEADAAYLLCTNPLEALHLLIQAAAKPSAAGQDKDTEPDTGAEPGPDDPRHLFDDRQVKPWEGGPSPADPPPAAGPDPQPQPDSRHPVPESAIHPSQHDAACPTCGHDPTRSSRESSALTLGVLPDLDPAKLRPPVVLYLHASQNEFRAGTGLTRFDNDGIALTHAEAVALLGHAHVKITRVIDLHHQPAVDAYEIPDTLAEQTRLLYPTTMTPWSGTSSRTAGTDLDHTHPYRPPASGGPPGQTRLNNLTPLTRASHRVKTHAPGWTTTHPLFGVHLWRTRHGYCFQRDPHGTTPLGKMTPEEFRTFTHDLAEHIAWDENLDPADPGTETPNTATA